MTGKVEESACASKETAISIDGKGLFVESCRSRITFKAYMLYVNSPRERAKIHIGASATGSARGRGGRITRPRFEVECSVKLFGALSARATDGPTRRFKESRESRPAINTRVKGNG